MQPTITTVAFTAIKIIEDRLVGEKFRSRDQMHNVIPGYGVIPGYDVILGFQLVGARLDNVPAL